LENWFRRTSHIFQVSMWLRLMAGLGMLIATLHANSVGEPSDPEPSRVARGGRDRHGRGETGGRNPSPPAGEILHPHVRPRAARHLQSHPVILRSGRLSRSLSTMDQSPRLV